MKLVNETFFIKNVQSWKWQSALSAQQSQGELYRASHRLLSPKFVFQAYKKTIYADSWWHEHDQLVIFLVFLQCSLNYEYRQLFPLTQGQNICAWQLSTNAVCSSATLNRRHEYLISRPPSATFLWGGLDVSGSSTWLTRLWENIFIYFYHFLVFASGISVLFYFVLTLTHTYKQRMDKMTTYNIMQSNKTQEQMTKDLN